MQIRNEIMHFQIKRYVILHESIDIQVKHSVMPNKRKNFQIKLPTVWNQIKRCQTKRYFANETVLSQINQAGNIKGAYTLVQRNTESYKPSEIGYYMVERDSLDELRMSGFVWVEKRQFR